MGDKSILDSLKDALWSPARKAEADTRTPGVKTPVATGTGGDNRQRAIDALVDQAVNGIDPNARMRAAQTTDGAQQ